VWSTGGYEFIHSGEVLRIEAVMMLLFFIRENQMEKKSISTDIVEIMAPMEDQIFHMVNVSG